VKLNYYLASPEASGNAILVGVRLDKTFLVMIGSDLYGESVAIARNISRAGLEVELPYAPPAGTLVTVSFRQPRYWVGASSDESDASSVEGYAVVKTDYEIVASAQVTHHYPVEDVRVVNLRFVAFPGTTIVSPGIEPVPRLPH